MKIHSNRFFIILFFLATVIKSYSQAGEKTGTNKKLFLSFQPAVLFEVPRGGLKIGAEKIVSPRVGIGLDAAYRFINYTDRQNLQPGEKESRKGLQLQPEVKWYFKNTKKSKKHFEPRNSVSLRLGYARYNDAFTNWTSFIDGTGNRYQKLTGYNRIQQNLDASILFNTKFYFSKEEGHWGGEFFTGLGARQKLIDYKNLSPGLDATELRQNDETAIFSLLREEAYPLFNLGVRVFYRL